MYSTYFAADDGTITCTRHAPDNVRYAIEQRPFALAYDGYARLTHDELDRYLNAAVRCTGCHEEMQIDRIALAIKFGGKK